MTQLEVAKPHGNPDQLIHKSLLILPCHTADVEGIPLKHLERVRDSEDIHFAPWRAAFRGSETEAFREVSGMHFTEEFTLMDVMGGSLGVKYDSSWASEDW